MKSLHDIEYELLISQRNQLVDALAKTNSTFQKTLLALFAGFATIAAAGSTSLFQNKAVILFAIQTLIMLIIFVATLLTVGNTQRFYISAIDTYLEEKYGIMVMFYQGKMAREHTIGKNSFFTLITFCAGTFSSFLMFWIMNELEIGKYLADNTPYILLLIMEFILMAAIVLYNWLNKFREPKEYRDCLNYLMRNEVVTPTERSF